MGLDAATQAEILRLYHAEHLSFRVIGKQLGIHRKTVSATVCKGSVTTKRRSPSHQRSTLLDPHKPQITVYLRQGCVT